MIRGLSPSQRIQLAQRIAAYVGVEGATGERHRLQATIKLAASASASLQALQAHLAEHLPDYMCPAELRPVSAFPRLPNGKVDRGAVAAEAIAPSPAPAAPAAQRGEGLTGPQQALLEIWSSVLQRSEIGVHDNFFALGGDSLAAMRVLTLARQRSLAFSVADLFSRPTIAELAPAEAPKEKTEAVRPMGSEAEGAVPLTPIQHWFFELGVPRRDHWNQSVLVELPVGTTSDRAEAAVAKLVEHHAALRLSFRRQAGGWGQVVLPFSRDRVSLRSCRIADDAELEHLASEMQRAMCLSAGRPLLAAWIEGSEMVAPRLLLVVHHLAVDAVSWGILLEDLEAALRQLSAGETVQLQPSSEPLKSWSERLTREAQSEETRREASFWAEVASRPVTIARDRESSSNLERDGEVWTQVEDLAATAAITAAAAADGRSVQGFLAAALAPVLARWTGRPGTVVGMEGHGRDQFGDGEDLSRTVGWATAYFPFVLEAVVGETAAARVDRLSRALRALPRRGIGFGLLRYLSVWLPEKSAIRTLQPEVIFNYLGLRGGGCRS